MRRNLFAAGAAALLMSTGTAHANARAFVNLSGAEVDLQGSGASFGDELVTFAVAPGQSETLSFAFVMSLSSDGLSAERTWGFSAPALDGYNGPNPTGLEQAVGWAGFVFDGRNTNDQDYMLSFTSSAPILFSVDRGSLFEWGTITVTATNMSDEFNQYATGLLLVEAFVDATPIPEPPAGLLLAAGLGAVALRHRGVRRASTQ